MVEIGHLYVLSVAAYLRTSVATDKHPHSYYSVTCMHALLLVMRS